MGRLERNLILRYLEEAGGNVSKASRLADVPRRTFYRLLEKNGIAVQRKLEHAFGDGTEGTL